MKKLSDKEQQFLLNLIKSCEYNHLNEKQSIECINNILNRNISRRSYYTYKRKIYSHDVFNRLKESIYNSHSVRSAILLLNDDADLEARAKVNKLIADQFSNKNPSPFQTSYLNENKEDTKDKVIDSLTKIRQFNKIENLSNNRLKSLPKNVTIREEFIKCGKDACNLCPHGPYYYAYWKDKANNNNSNKLRKKYLGSIDPR